MSLRYRSMFARSIDCCADDRSIASAARSVDRANLPIARNIDTTVCQCILIRDVIWLLFKQFPLFEIGHCFLNQANGFCSCETCYLLLLTSRLLSLWQHHHSQTQQLQYSWPTINSPFLLPLTGKKTTHLSFLMYTALGEYIAGVRRRRNVVTCKSRQAPCSFF